MRRTPRRGALITKVMCFDVFRELLSFLFTFPHKTFASHSLVMPQDLAAGNQNKLAQFGTAWQGTGGCGLRKNILPQELENIQIVALATCLEVLHTLSELDPFNGTTFQQVVVVVSISRSGSPAAPSCKSLLVISTDFPSQNKILLWSTACFSAPGEALRNSQLGFFPPVPLSASCAA